MTLLALTASYGAPGPLIQATLLANNALFFVVGVRTFRGRGESTTPREWWRVTATSRSSVVMGVIALMFGSIIVARCGFLGGCFLQERAPLGPGAGVV